MRIQILLYVMNLLHNEKPVVKIKKNVQPWNPAAHEITEYG
ncbi:hypothetical protein [Desulfomarina profundi]|nr:hypothetical protein [Desulfomarina profundi]